MNPALLSKELRLLRPVLVAALIVALGPVLLASRETYWGAQDAFLLYPAVVAAALLGLTPFGREFGLATFGLQLVQPLERNRVWWTKLGLLGFTLVLLYGTWRGMLALKGLPIHGTAPEGIQWLAFSLALAVAASGLWSTLLLRQVAAAFWFTVFVPVGLAAAGSALGMEPRGVAVTLLVYAGLSTVLAYTLFHRAQEVPWTGGTIVLPGERRKLGAAVGASADRPGTALMRKELNLHRATLLAVGGLFALHLGAIIARQFVGLYDPVRPLLDFFPFFWVFVPLVVGATSIAEERRMGTMQGHLVLPVGIWKQFLIKLGMVVLVGGLVPAALLGLAEHGLATVLRVPAQVGFLGPDALVKVLFWTMLALGGVAFFASSMTRGLLSALGVAVVLALAGFALARTGSLPFWIGPGLWEGPLFHWVVWPGLGAVLFMLARQNFRISEGASWRLNLGSMAGVLAATMALTALVYNRVWEFVLPLEPAHGRAQLSLEQPPLLRSWRGDRMAVRLPDGRVFLGLGRYSPQDSTLGKPLRYGTVWSVEDAGFLGGRDWADALFLRHITAIKTDRSLWVSEDPVREVDGRLEGLPPRMIRVGADSEWTRFVRPVASVLLLKRDGSLWAWGSLDERHETNRLVKASPRPVEGASGITRVAEGNGSLYFWRGAEAYAVVPRSLPGQGSQNQDDLRVRRVPEFDRDVWRSVARMSVYEIGVREDGTLWRWRVEGTADQNPTALEQLGPGNSWREVEGWWGGSVAALKSDGSLWAFSEREHGEERVYQRPWRRLSVHNDWVAIGSLIGDTVAISADGGLWYWRTAASYYDEGLLARSRVPVHLGNLLDATATP